MKNYLSPRFFEFKASIKIIFYSKNSYLIPWALSVKVCQHQVEIPTFPSLTKSTILNLPSLLKKRITLFFDV